MILKNIIKKLKECTAEDVGMHGGTAVVYTELFTTICESPCNRIFNCDGYWTLPDFFGKDVHMLTEYKGDVNLKSHLELCKVLAQCVYYLKSFQDNAYTIPKIVFIGDKNECVLVPTTAFFSNALNCGSDFSYSASSAASDEKLMKCLLDNYLLKTFPLVLDIDDDFDEKSLISIMHNIAKSDANSIPLEINEHNINMVWKAFARNVFGSRTKVAPNEQVSIFVHFITNHDDFIIDRNNPKRFSLNGKVYDVNDPLAFGRFCRSFDHIRSVKQKEKLRATCDRFIEDNNRRLKGEFYTPTEFVDYAHDMIAKEFGEDWKEKYVVWDCAWGTGNLTRDYKFKELYCSTLEQSELDIAAAINPEATKFQYDFLNDDFEKLPEGLQKAFKEKKPILFLINPPYATAGTQMGLNLEGGSGLGLGSLLQSEMKNRGIGVASKEMYAQFLYRVVKLKENYGSNVNLALFCNPKFLTGPRFDKFRDLFLSKMEYRSGIIFNAGHFSNVSASWGITFNVWRDGKTVDTNNFVHDVVDVDTNGNIVKVDTKTLYNAESDQLYIEASRKFNKGFKGVPSCVLKNALEVSEKYDESFRLSDDSLGYIHNANAVSQFVSFSFFLSTICSHKNGLSIRPQNFTECMNRYAVSKLVIATWLNDKDEMLYPNTEHHLYETFCNDAMVFSSFHGLASSMRNVEQGGKLWDIKNEFFWMSREELLNLADNAGFEELYNDAKQSEERFVYKKLQTLNLSEEARAVIDKATEIVKKSFEYRKEVHDTRPEYHLNAWDAGWYQIKKLCSELPMMKDDMEEFKRLFKRLSDKMRPMVYELGFLKR